MSIHTVNETYAWTACNRVDLYYTIGAISHSIESYMAGNIGEKTLGQNFQKPLKLTAHQYYMLYSTSTLPFQFMGSGVSGGRVASALLTAAVVFSSL